MKVIVGVDDSPCSDAALHYIANAPWPKASRFIVVSAVAPVIAGPGEAISVMAIEQVLVEQEKYHSEIAEKAAARLRKGGMSAEGRMVRGDPRTVLEEAARQEKADMIVLGSHGRSGLKKLLLGSVASHVVTHAPCSVLVVKTSG